MVKKAIATSHHPDGKTYGEIQGGRVVIQEHLDKMPPETEQVWTEYWYPVRQIGTFNGANKDAAMAASIIPSNSQNILNLRILGTGTFKRTVAEIEYAGAETIRKSINGKISPEGVITQKINLPFTTSKDKELTVKLIDKDGRKLAQAWLTVPNKQDSWTKIPKEPLINIPALAQEHYQDGENLNRDWIYHNPEPAYKKALQLDPCHTGANLELAKIEISKGEYDSAIKYLKTALQRDGDNLEARYFLGQSLWLANDIGSAKKEFELAGKYDYEARSKTRLAEICISKNEFQEAMNYLLRVKDAFPRLTRARCLLAIVYRKLDMWKTALSEIDQALQIDPTDPFLCFEKIFITEKKSGRLIKTLLDQVAPNNEPLVEAAFDYLRAGLHHEALSVTKLIPKLDSLTLFLKAWLEAQCSLTKDSQKTLAQACRHNPANSCAWRLEMIEILNWAMQNKQARPRAMYHLGNLLMARHYDNKALDLWKNAAQSGEKYYILHSSLGYYSLKVLGDKTTALKYFKQAASLAKDDIYLLSEISSIFHSLEKYDRVISLLTPKTDLLKKSFIIAYHLLNAYLAKQQYIKFDDFCSKHSYRENWRLPGPRSLWAKRHFQEALELLAKDRDIDRAIELLNNAHIIPPHLGHPGHEEPQLYERQLYHLGRCYQSKGNMDRAKQCWNKILQIDRFPGYEPAHMFDVWKNHYFVALAHQKLKNEAQAEIIFNAMEIIAKSVFDIPYAARKHLMQLVIQGRFMEEKYKDPADTMNIEVSSRAED